jgi:hypothetical protein
MGPPMTPDNAERWHELWEQAADEQDPHKLRVLIEEIFALAADRQRHTAANLAANEPPRTPLGLGNV